jgi:FMN phosphatase YigB (HAD superfamily)
MIKAIIFDCFGVLTTEGFTLFCDTYFPDNPEKRQRALELITRHDAGLATRLEYMTELAELAGVGVGVVSEHISGHNKPNQPLIEYIKSNLKPKYKIGVLSNAGGDYISEIIKPEDIAIFDDIVLSYQHHVVKPQPEIFELSAQRLGVALAECVFVDDSQSHCDGATRAGMKAIVYKDLAKFKIDLEKALTTAADN